MVGEAKVGFKAGPGRGTGRGGKGKDCRAGVVCVCLVRLGGLQPVLALVRLGASDK